MMKYGYKTPHQSIAEFVKEILVIEDFDITNPFTLPLFANGCPTLLFQTKKGLLNKEPSGNLTLFGQTITPGALTLQEDFTLIAYCFKPHSLLPLFHVAGDELKDSNVDLNLLKHLKCSDIEDQLLNCSSADDMILHLDNYVLQLIHTRRKVTTKVDIAIGLLEQHAAFDTLKKVKDSLYVTEKTLQRMFNNHVGISPRLYKRICQFNTAFRQINSRVFTKLSDLAYNNGYADQSHFIRSFKEFTGFTPHQYLQFSSAKSS